MANTTATFLQAVEQAHAAFAKDLSDLDRIARSDASPHPVPTANRLSEARNDVAKHFELEEQDGGFLNWVVDRAPQHVRTVEMLRTQHRELLLALEALAREVERLADSEAGSGSFKKNLRHWVSKVRQHEAQENRLALEIFNSDISASD